MKKIIAVLAAGMLLCGALAGCGGSGSSAATDSKTEDTTAAASTAAPTTKAPETTAPTNNKAVAGTWVIEGFVYDGNTYGIEEYAELIGSTSDLLAVTYSFTEDGKAVCSAAGASVNGTYTFDGTTLQTSFDASNPKFTYDAESDALLNDEATTGVITVMVRAEDDTNEAGNGEEAAVETTAETAEAADAVDSADAAGETVAEAE